MDHLLGGGPTNFPLRGSSAGAWKDLDGPEQRQREAWDQDFEGEVEETVGASVIVTDFVLRCTESVRLAHPLQLRHGVAVHGGLSHHLISHRGGRTPHGPEEGQASGVCWDIMMRELRIQV